MNPANWITTVRLVVTVGLLVCLEVMRDPARPNETLTWWAFGMFIFAAVTDAADGFVARRYGLVTRLGRILDPFADKILICGTLTCLLRFPAATALLQTWMVVVILGRELLVTTMRGVAEAAGVAFPAEPLGKWKMVAQCIATGALLTMVAGCELFVTTAAISLWVTLALTTVSALSYSLRARTLLGG